MSKYFSCFKSKKEEVYKPKKNPVVQIPVLEPIPIPDGLIELMGLEEECKKQIRYLEEQSAKFMGYYKYSMKNGRSVQAMENLKLYKATQMELGMFRDALTKVEEKLSIKYNKH